MQEYLPLPLSFTEKDRAYQAQISLHAVKRCNMCSLILPVGEFAGYGAQPCLECAWELGRLKRSSIPTRRLPPAYRSQGG